MNVYRVLQKTPNTLFLTISRRASGLLNNWAVEALFPDLVPLTVVPGDPESNVNNYHGSKMVHDVPMDVPIYAGLRVTLTKNRNKKIGFVNGMAATVLGVTVKGYIRVRTDQGREIAIHPWTPPDSMSGQAYFPLRVGYASTLHKVQGMTLEHITLWLDAKNAPAAAYVALSRVEYDANWQYMSDPCVHHFTPRGF